MAPVRLAGWLVKALGRIAVGAVGVLFMTAGLGLWHSLQLAEAGVAIMAVGFLLAVKAVF